MQACSFARAQDFQDESFKTTFQYYPEECDTIIRTQKNEITHRATLYSQSQPARIQPAKGQLWIHNRECSIVVFTHGSSYRTLLTILSALLDFSLVGAAMLGHTPLYAQIFPITVGELMHFCSRSSQARINITQQVSCCTFHLREQPSSDHLDII